MGTAAQLGRTQLAENEADVQARTVTAEIHKQAAAAHETLELRRVVVLKQLFGLQLRIRRVPSLPDVAGMFTRCASLR